MSNKQPSGQTEPKHPVDEASTRQAATEHSPDYDKVTPHQQELQKIVPRIQILIPVLICLLLLNALINDSFTPAFAGMASDFHTSIAYIQGIVPYYLIGNGMGQWIAGPFIDRFGRRTIIVICVIAAIALNLWLVNTDVYGHLVIIRVLQGFIFAGIGMVPSVVLRDIFSPRQFVRYNAMMWTVFMFAPALAPIVGGYIYVHWGWHAIFNLINLVCLISAAIYLSKIPETLDPLKRQPFNTKRILTNYGIILRDFNSRLLLVVEIFFATAIFAFPSFFPAVALESYGVAPERIGWFVLVQLVAVAISIQANQLLLARGYNLAKNWLYGICVQATTGLLNVVFAVSVLLGQSLLNEYVLISLVALNFACNGFIGANLFAMFLMKYDNMTGTASSLINSIAFLIPGAIVAGLSHLPAAAGATLLLINAGCFACMVPLAFYYRAKNPALYGRAQ